MPICARCCAIDGTRENRKDAKDTKSAKKEEGGRSMGVDLTDKVAIVTGAAQGIGEATARKLAERGARIIGVDIAGDTLNTVMASIGGMAIVHDVTDAEGDVRLIADLHRQFGRIDILVNV